MRNRERDTGQGQRLNPVPAQSGPLRPQASLRPSVRRRAPGLRTGVSARSPTPGRPCLSASPSSAPRRRSRHHVTLAPLFPRGGFAETRLSLGARPFASREPPRRVLPHPPLFSLAGGSPHRTSGRHPFTQFCLFSGRRLVCPRPHPRPAFPPLFLGLPIPCAFPVDSQGLTAAVVGYTVDGVLARTTRSCQIGSSHASFVVCITSWKAHIELQKPSKLNLLFLNGSQVRGQLFSGGRFLSWRPVKPGRTESEMQS